MNTKWAAGAVATVVVFSGISFYGGVRYQRSRSQPVPFGQNFQNLTPEQRQQAFGQLRSSGNGTRRVSGQGFWSGEVISRDDKSITVKSRDGSTKIVFYSGATSVGKLASGTPADLAVGTQVTVTGSAGQDGTLTAESIQLRPSGSAPMP